MVSSYFQAFVNCKCLEELFIDLENSISQNALDAIKTSLKMNNRLKKFNIHSTSKFDIDFIAEVNFKLTELDLRGFLFDGPFSVQLFNKFLVTQNDSLNILVLSEWHKIFSIMTTILSMPRLKELRLVTYQDVRYLSNLKPSAELLPKSVSITSLSLFSLRCIDKTFKNFLNAFPNVQFFHLDLINDENVDEIAKALKSLKILDVDEFEVKNMSSKEFYLNLEEIYCFSRNLEFMRLDKERSKKLNKTEFV